MAFLVSNQSGNITDPTIWYTCLQTVSTGTASNDTESNAAAITSVTTLSAPVFSVSTAQPLQGIALLVSSCTTTFPASATITLDLLSATPGSSSATRIPNTVVTLPLSVIEPYQQVAAECGFTFFKFPTPIALQPNVNFTFRLSASTASSISVYRINTTANNWSRLLVLSSAPVSIADNDYFYICNPNIRTSRLTVTMNNTNQNALSAARVRISTGCDMVYGNTPGNTYYLGLSTGMYAAGPSSTTACGLICDGNATLVVGTSSQPISSDNTGANLCVAKLHQNCSTNLTCGLLFRNTAKFITYGMPKTAGVTLSANALKTTNLLYLNNTVTNWLTGDLIYIPGTVRGSPRNQFEKRLLSAFPTPTTAQLTTTLTFNHSGGSPITCYPVNATRNIQIYGNSLTLAGFCTFVDNSLVNCYNTEFVYMGHDSTSVDSYRRCHMNIYLNNCPTTQIIDGCVFREVANTVATAGAICVYLREGTTNLEMSNSIALSSSTGINSYGTQTITCRNCYVYGMNLNAVTIGNTGHLYDCVVGCGNAYGLNLLYNNYTTPNTTTMMNVTGCVVQYMNSNGAYISHFTNFRDNLIYGNVNHGLYFQPVNVTGQTLSSYFYNVKSIGNGSAADTHNVYVDTNSVLDFDLTFNNLTATGHPLLPSVDAGLKVDIPIASSINFVNARFGELGAHSSVQGDVQIPNTAASNYIAGNVNFYNSVFASTTDFVGAAYTDASFKINSINHQNITGNHKIVTKFGNITTDSSIYRTNAPAERLTPINASRKLKSSSKGVNLNSGDTCTVSVWIYISSSTAYNGTTPRLMQVANAAMGHDGVYPVYSRNNTSDIILATANLATVGSWQQLTGNVTAATADGSAQFYVDCDGTTGWVTIDDWEVV
jgi:hypothetical protein